MRKSYFLLFGLLVFSFIPSVFAQTNIVVNATTPCFLNYTASYRMWENCDAKGDWLKFALLPFEWITGGYFSLMVVGTLIIGSWLKYHKTIYPIMIGMLFLPISYSLFPDVFLQFAIPFVGLAIVVLIYKMFTRQTKEYD